MREKNKKKNEEVKVLNFTQQKLYFLSNESE